MAKPVTRYAEPAPPEPRNHAQFETFIRELDAGRVPRPLKPTEERAGTEPKTN